MENKKSISYLRGKTWYRFIKVVFILAFLVALLFWNWAIYASYNDPVFYILNPAANSVGVRLFTSLVGNLVIILIFEAIRRAFYYIVLGSIKPKK
jgi:hypothetical protein